MAEYSVSTKITENIPNLKGGVMLIQITLSPNILEVTYEYPKLGKY